MDNSGKNFLQTYRKRRPVYTHAMAYNGLKVQWCAYVYDQLVYFTYIYVLHGIVSRNFPKYSTITTSYDQNLHMIAPLS